MIKGMTEEDYDKPFCNVDEYTQKEAIQDTLFSMAQAKKV